ncbi:MAG: NAD(P)/FAD-dependent oxidoreductase [Novosphingobium sp.]|nr:NAD(P)/FAD-dependent oxidoreductase [Novosphingobium sp.]MCP5404146.1 NAD(P)/FAD-dependent oxidoreductase [Novosphingobium sp.]
MDRTDAVVIGAGVVGLATARALALEGRDVIVLEREDNFGLGTSSRNSEVIHAGIHYPHGSLKERLCIEGKRRLYEYCASRHVLHSRCGKLTFAANESERARLEAIAAHAEASGADEDLAWLDRGEAAQVEPAIDCVAALLSPSSGIVDSHALMLSLLGEAEDHGAMLARNAPAERVERSGEHWCVHVGETRLQAGIVVNAAGLHAQSVAASIDALDACHIPPRHLAKGSYFTYSGKVPFTRLIYPVPIKGGLGTHLTLDMAGQARFGPDVEWVEAIDYAVDPARKPAFLESVRQFWPQVDPDKLSPGYSGIRPKLTGPAEPDADFLIQGPQVHGLPGLVNLFGIESPGLTSSLAIAEEVVSACRQSG